MNNKSTVIDLLQFTKTILNQKMTSYLPIFHIYEKMTFLKIGMNLKKEVNQQ